jgi:L-alanine-DL-glutamate epimerase-like enolase superfamily enzyme
LVLDFAWSWPSAKEKVGLVRRLEEFEIAWVEDPFPRHQIADFVHLRNNVGTLIGAGDEATRPADIKALMGADGIDVVRLDATTIGGYERVRELSALARAKSLKVSFHERPEIHEHCVFGLNTADHVEIFPTDRPFDRVHDIIQNSTFDRVRNGRLAPSDVPGTGLKLRDDAVAHYAHRHTRIGA